MEITFIFFSVIIILAALMLSREIHHLRESLKAENARLEKRIADLEQASKKRVPYRTQEELLDAMAALDTFQNEINLGKAMIENAKSHIAKGLQVGTIRQQTGEPPEE